MKNIMKGLNKFKHILTFILAICLTLTIALSVSGRAKSSYTFDNKTIDTEAFGDELPTKTNKVYLTRDFVLKDDYVIPSSQQIRIYLNGHNIDLNGHQIRIAGSLIIYDDRTNPTFYSLDSNGNVIEGKDYVVNGGLITGATSDYAIVVDGSSADFYLRGGNVFGNAAGGIKVTNGGKVFINSGSVSGNKAATGAGINVATSNAQLTVTNGVIEHNMATSSAAGIYQNGIISVSGSAIIRNNKLTSGTNSNLYVPSTNTSNAKIRVSGSLTGRIGITSSSTDKLTSSFGSYNSGSNINVSDYFFSDDSTKYITSSGTGNSQEAIFTTTKPTHTHSSTDYTEWTYDNALPTGDGNYCLTKDVTLSKAYKTSGTTTICLNGHTINLNGKYIEITSSSTFTITDCSKEIHYYDVDETGLGVVGGTNHKFIGGYIYGGKVYRAIKIDVKTATFNMNGGALIGNSGGAVKIFYDTTPNNDSGNAKAYFRNCYIVGNTSETADDKEGSAIYAGEHNGVSLYNTTIQYNKTYTDSGAVYTAGSVSVPSRINVQQGVIITENRDINGNLCNFYLRRNPGHTIGISASLQNGGNNKAKIGVTLDSEITNPSSYLTFTTGYSEHNGGSYKPSDFFFSDRAWLSISENTNSSYVTEGTVILSHKHDSTTYSPIQIFTTSNSGNYVARNNLTLTGDITVPANKTIVIDLAGHTLDLNGHSITIPSSSSLKIIDCSKFSSKYYINSNGLAVVDDKKGTTSFNHSYIYDSQSIASTPTTTNPFFKVTGGTLELEDVNIFGSYVANSGSDSDNGAICITNGTFNMTNGMIAGCKGNYGCVIHMYDKDYPSQYSLKAKATLTNVKLLDNTGANSGPIFTYYSQVTMTDCYLVNNKTTGSGGAINLGVGVKAAISYSYFYNNEATYSGGAIYTSSSAGIDITNCEFAYNKSNAKGGAIYCSSYLNLTTVTCVYNESKDEGGAIYYGGSGCYLQLAKHILISSNKSSSNGGGMYIDNALGVSGEIIIKNNTANGKTSNVTIKESFFDNNKNICLNSSLTGDTSIGINSTKAGKITIQYGDNHSTTDPQTYFFADDEDSSISLKNSEVYYEPPHVHSFTYSTSGNILKAKCSDCGEEATISLTASNVTYDGQTHGATYDATAFAEFVGFTPTITITYSGTNSSTAPKNAGSYTATAKTTINGTTYTFTKSFTISKKTVTVSGITANNKTYDGASTATLSYSSVAFNGIVSGDTLTVTATGTFNSINVGSNITVGITNITLNGTSKGNYTLATSGNQSSTKANITPKAITISGISASNKTYDGTTTAKLGYTNVKFGGKVAGDTLTVTATGNFASKNAGSNITVNITNITLSGSSISNYTLATSGNQTSAVATIFKKEVTISGIKANDKVYDGNDGVTYDCTNAVITGKVESDDLTVKVYGAFDSKIVGTDKAVTVKISSLGGTDAANYTVATSGNQTSTTASILAKEVTISGITASNKTYDGTDSATLVYSNVVITGLITGDTLSVTATGKFNNYNAGSNRNITISDFVLSGYDCNNYAVALSGNQASTTATINKAKVKVDGIKTKNKVYDGTTSVEFDYSDVVITGLITGDNLTVTATGAFIDASYGTNKKVEITSITLGGTSVGNYQLSSTGNQTMTSGNITKDIMNVTVDAFNGTYDGNSHSITISVTPTNATIKYSTNGVDYSTTKPEFTSAGTYIVYYLLECNNYETVNNSAIVSINKKLVTISGITAEDKIYDGSTGMTLNLNNVVINGLVDGDTLTVSASGVIYGVTGKDAGNNKTVHISNLVLVGDKKNNYQLDTTNCQHETTASIFKKGITVSNIKANDKYYDDTTSAELDLNDVIYDGIIANEVLTISGDANFVDSACGENKTVNLTNLKLTGDYAINYYLTDECQTEATATINKALMGANVESFTGTYDKIAHSISITDILNDVVITYSESENGEYRIGNYAYTNAGTYTVFYRIEKENYETISGSATVTINQKEVTISGIKANDKEYDGTTNVDLDLSTAVIEGLIDNDVTVNVKGSFESKEAGSNKKVNITEITLSNPNYKASSASQKEATATINTKKIIITSIKVLDKAYDKTTDATIDYDNVIIEGLVDGDKVTITAKASFADSKTGNDKKVLISEINIDGMDKANYELQINQLETSANITKAKSKGLNGGAVAGIVIAIVVVIAGASVGAVLFIKKKSVKA